MSFPHGRMLATLGLLFNETCTVQEPSNVNTLGNVVKGPWSDVAGLVDIPCRVSPISAGRENRGADYTYSEVTHYVTLAGDYGTAEPHMQAVVAGVAYEILAVVHDGHGAMTRLATRVLQ